LEERITEPQPNVIESSAGFSVSVLGRVGLRYQEGDRSIRINSEVLAAPRGIVMLKDSIKYWEGPNPGKVSDADLDRIVSNVKRAFEACGYELEVQEPDYELLAWYSEHKRAAEQRHLTEQREHGSVSGWTYLDKLRERLRRRRGPASN
jgi:hypothetical protein